MSHISKEQQQLLLAIRSNNGAMVKQFLEEGANANIAPEIPSFSNWEDNERKAAEGSWLLAASDTVVTPLHWSVLNCYWNYGDINSQHSYDFPTRAQNALNILHLLLSHGADPSISSPSLVVLVNVGPTASHNRWLPAPFPMRPVDLALFLAQQKRTDGSQRAFLDSVIRCLADSRGEADSALRLPAARVHASALRTWTKLLESESLKDVRFVCGDGVELGAHKAVLSAASDYFRAMFDDRGKRSSNDANVVSVAGSSEMMKGVLSFVYTGAIDSALLSSLNNELLVVASFYQLEELRQLSERSCVRSLSASTVKPLLCLAHLHSAVELKEAAFAFVRRHATSVLTRMDMMSIASEDPPLWAELVSKIGEREDSDLGSKKRVREDGDGS